jgi:hypothetical protein
MEIIQPVLAPAVMISAGSLMSLAQFTRYTAVVAQLRSLHRERITIAQKLRHTESDDREQPLQRAKSLEHQSDQMLIHVTTVKNALRFLVWGALLMMFCSLTVGASLLFEVLSFVAVGFFILGLIAMSVGLYLVLTELRVSLEAIELEQDELRHLLRRLSGCYSCSIENSLLVSGDE